MNVSQNGQSYEIFTTLFFILGHALLASGFDPYVWSRHTITGISPSLGSTEGGTKLTIEGNLVNVLSLNRVNSVLVIRFAFQK